MKTNKIVKKLSNTAAKVGFVVKKHSPEILATAGTVGVIASTVMACKATLKVNEIIDDAKKTLDDISTMEGNENAEYTHEDAKKDRIILYTQTGLKLAKLYAPAVGLGVLSVAGLLTSNHILRKRAAAIAAAYTILDTDFKDYRKRVVERFGDEVDKQLRHNFTQDKITEETVDEDGKAKKSKKVVNVADPSAESDYLKYFTRTNQYWKNDEEYLKMFFRGQQNYANDMLRARGHITLNEVYDLLGFKHTKAGFITGWTYNELHPLGDNFIEFNIEEVYLPGDDGVLEQAFSIDFNVDGVIYDKI